MNLNCLATKQSVKEVLIGRAVKTTIQKLYDKDFFDNYDNADVVLKYYPLIIFLCKVMKNVDLT